MPDMEEKDDNDDDDQPHEDEGKRKIAPFAA